MGCPTLRGGVLAADWAPARPPQTTLRTRSARAATNCGSDTTVVVSLGPPTLGGDRPAPAGPRGPPRKLPACGTREQTAARPPPLPRAHPGFEVVGRKAAVLDRHAAKAAATPQRALCRLAALVGRCRSWRAGAAADLLRRRPTERAPAGGRLSSVVGLQLFMTSLRASKSPRAYVGRSQSLRREAG